MIDIKLNISRSITLDSEKKQPFQIVYLLLFISYIYNEYYFILIRNIYIFVLKNKVIV